MKLSGAIAAGVVGFLPTTVWAAAQEPSISGNTWVAYAIIGGLALVVLLFVLATVGLSRRDEAARANRKGGDDDGLPIFGGDDD